MRFQKAAPNRSSPAPIKAPRQGVISMTADKFRTVSTMFAAMFVSALLVAASTSTHLVA
jgi:hypothetical protein